MREAIVLAGGLGTRLRSVVSDCPKPMATVAGRPFLEWHFDALHAQGVTDLVLAIGYMGEMIKDHFGPSYRGMALEYSHETVPLGTGGAIRKAMTMCKSDEIFTMNGDTFSSFSLSDMILAMRPGIDCLMAVTKVPDAFRFGAVEWDQDGSQKEVVAFQSKGVPGPAWINTGTYLVRRLEFLAWTERTSFSMESDYLEAMCKDCALGAFPVDSNFIDIGIPEDLERAQTHLPRCSNLSTRA